MASTLFVAVLNAFLALVFAYASYLSAREWRVYYFLNKQGEATQAKIVELSRNNKGRGNRYFVSYRFNVNEFVYESRQQISRSHFKQFSKSKEVVIRYLPKRPAISRLSEDNFDNTFRNLITYIALAGILVWPPLLIVWIVCFVLNTLLLSHSFSDQIKRKRDESIC